MKQTAFAFAAAALVALVLLPSPPASARCYGCGVAAGVVGGVAAGAIIGSAIAGSQPVYVAPPPPPPPSEVYYDEPDHPVCHVEHRRYFEEGFGWRSRRVEVCE